jgi:PKD repeat protein
MRRRCCCGAACDLVAGFTHDNPYGFHVNFTDTSTSSVAITAWAWDFGDGGTSTLQNPSHTYSGVGPYTVTLTATDANGCEDDASAEIEFITCSCSDCTPTSTPDEVLVDLQDGTSPWGCTVCTGLGGAYVLDCVGFCTWEYTGVSAGSCRVCASPTTPVVVNLVITAAVVTSGGNKILQVTVRFTYASSGGTGCETGTAVYQFNLGSGSVNCFGSRTLSKTSSSGTNLCDHGATVDLTI